jgi:hypothetical protein
MGNDGFSQISPRVIIVVSGLPMVYDLRKIGHTFVLAII